MQNEWCVDPLPLGKWGKAENNLPETIRFSAGKDMGIAPVCYVE